MKVNMIRSVFVFFVLFLCFVCADNEFDGDMNGNCTTCDNKTEDKEFDGNMNHNVTTCDNEEEGFNWTGIIVVAGFMGIVVLMWICGLISNHCSDSGANFSVGIGLGVGLGGGGDGCV